MPDPVLDPFDAIEGKHSGSFTPEEPGPADEFGSLRSRAGEFHNGVDAERQPPKKRCRRVDHRQRTRELLESFGWSVTLVETKIRFRNGMVIKSDLMGLWDFLCIKQGNPQMYVQVCGDKKDVQAHLRKMTSDKVAMDNKRPRRQNLEDCMSSGNLCRIVSWTKQPNGRYVSEIVKVDRDLVDAFLARKRR